MRKACCAGGTTEAIRLAAPFVEVSTLLQLPAVCKKFQQVFTRRELWSSCIDGGLATEDAETCRGKLWVHLSKVLEGRGEHATVPTGDDADFKRLVKLARQLQEAAKEGMQSGRSGGASCDVTLRTRLIEADAKRTFGLGTSSGGTRGHASNSSTGMNGAVVVLRVEGEDGDSEEEQEQVEQEQVEQEQQDLDGRVNNGHLNMAALKDVLHAYALANPTIDYCQGMNFVTALLLRRMPPTEAFHVLLHLMPPPMGPTESNPNSGESGTEAQASTGYEASPAVYGGGAYGAGLIGGLFAPGLPLVKLCLFQLRCLLRLHLPDLADHFEAEGALPTMYASGWFMTCFTNLDTLPLHVVECIWDHFLIDGWKVIMRCVLALLKRVQVHLIRHDFGTMMELLHLLPMDDLDHDALVVEGQQFKVTNSMLAMLEELYKEHSMALEAALDAEEAASIGGQAQAQLPTARSMWREGPMTPLLSSHHTRKPPVSAPRVQSNGQSTLDAYGGLAGRPPSIASFSSFFSSSCAPQAPHSRHDTSHMNPHTMEKMQSTKTDAVPDGSSSARRGAGRAGGVNGVIAGDEDHPAQLEASRLMLSPVSGNVGLATMANSNYQHQQEQRMPEEQPEEQKQEDQLSERQQQLLVLQQRWRQEQERQQKHQRTQQQNQQPPLPLQSTPEQLKQHRYQWQQQWHQQWQHQQLLQQQWQLQRLRQQKLRQVQQTHSAAGTGVVGAESDAADAAAAANHDAVRMAEEASKMIAAKRALAVAQGGVVGGGRGHSAGAKTDKGAGAKSSIDTSGIERTTEISTDSSDEKVKGVARRRGSKSGIRQKEEAIYSQHMRPPRDEGASTVETRHSAERKGGEKWAEQCDKKEKENLRCRANNRASGGQTKSEAGSVDGNPGSVSNDDYSKCTSTQPTDVVTRQFSDGPAPPSTADGGEGAAVPLVKRLVEAAKLNDLFAVQQLVVQFGAQIDAYDEESEDEKGITVAHIAAYHGYPAMLRLCAQLGANLNAKDVNGVTPLHLAAVQGNRASVQVLRLTGADMNMRANSGITPAHLAALKGHNEVLKLLHGSGANLRAVSKQGKSVLQVARHNGKKETEQLVLQLTAMGVATAPALQSKSKANATTATARATSR
jgi:hypothetical protein